MKSLQEAKFTVIADGNMASFLMIYLNCLGARNVRLIKTSEDEGFLPKLLGRDNIEDSIERMEQNMCLNSTRCIDGSLFGTPDIMIFASNSQEILDYSLRHYFSKKDIGLMISASCSKQDARLIIHDKSRAYNHLYNNPLIEYSGKDQGAYTAAAITAIMLDEARNGYSVKRESSGFFQYSTTPIDNFQNKKILVIGTGGIGTYFCICALLEGAMIKAYDGDSIERTNLDRQFLYCGNVGKKKAEVMRERLRIFGNRLITIDEYITKNNIETLNDFDAIACCVDNWQARITASKLSILTKKPLINGGVNAFSANIECYVPEESDCMTCSKGLFKLANNQKERAGCYLEREPNIVTTNAIAGSIMVGEFASGMKKSIAISYQSNLKNKLKIRETKESCNPTICICKCHRRLHERRI